MTVMRASTKKIDKYNQQEEGEGQIYFPPQFTEIKEGERQIDEKKEPEWMDAQLKKRGKYINQLLT